MSRAYGLLEEITSTLNTHGDVRAVWLAGSRGRGTNDEFSDIDIWIALDDAAMALVVDDPLAFIHGIVPTVMHINAPSIAPPDGAFLGSWVPVGEEFVQVDWYIAPTSSAIRDADTKMIFGDVPVRESFEMPEPPPYYARAKAQDNLIFALQMINNMVKHARRGHMWRAADHARHADNCLVNARSFLEFGSEPDFLTSRISILPEPPPVDVSDVQNLALLLLDEVQALSTEAGANLDAAIASMRYVVDDWRASGWKPTEEYYRTLPRRYMGAGMLITDTENNVLLLETTYKEFHEIPGGVSETGESPRETARREVREELGLSIEPGPLLVFDSRAQPAPKGDAIMLIYDGGIINDPSTVHIDTREVARFHFEPAERLHKFCAPHMANRLQAALRARELGSTIEVVNGNPVN